MNILIVEDESTCRDLIKLHLLKFKEQFYALEINEAGSLAEGKELYERLDPDMVLLDGQLPDSDFEETLKAIPRFAMTSAVVMLTNQEKLEGVAQAFKMGAVDYLTKNLLTQGKEFVKTLNSAWSNFERKSIAKTGSFPTLRVKQVSEELLAVAEKSMTQPELKSLIEFSTFAKANLETVQKKIEKMYQTIYEGNGTPSMKQDIAELKDSIGDIKKKLDESLETEKVKVTERWKFFTAVGLGLVSVLTVVINFVIKYAETIFKLH